MSKGTNNIGKAILGTGLASAFCGLMLYGAGQALSLLFRDATPGGIETEETAASDRIKEKEPAVQDKIRCGAAAGEPETIESETTEPEAVGTESPAES